MSLSQLIVPLRPFILCDMKTVRDNRKIMITKRLGEGTEEEVHLMNIVLYV